MLNTYSADQLSRERRSKLIFNCMASLLIGILGVFFSSFQSIADRVAMSFGQASSLVGLFISVFAAGSFISVYLNGALSDLIGKKKVVVTAILCSIVGSFVVGISQSYVLTLVGLFLMGVGFGPAEAMSSAIMTDENPESATRWMNISQVVYCAGAISAPVAAIWYCSEGGKYNDIFLLCSAAFALLLIYFIRIPYGKMPSGIQRTKKDVRPLTLLKNKQFLLYAVMIFFYIGYDAIGPAYIKQMFMVTNSTEQVAATGISVFWIAMITGRTIGIFMNGKERLGVRLFTPLAILGALLMLVAGTQEVRLVAAFLYGLGCGPVWPLMFVLAAKIAPERSGAAYAVMMSFCSAGHMLFPALLGTWLGNVYFTFIGCGILAALVFVGSLFIKNSAHNSLS